MTLRSLLSRYLPSLDRLDQQQMRRLLLIGVPALLVLAGGVYYLFSGRYVSTDNAYAKANTVSLSPNVTGRITHVFVQQNEWVKAGDPIFEIDPSSYRISLEQADAELASAAANVKSLQARYEMTVSQLQLAQSNIDYYKRNFERQDALAKRAFASQANLDTARHNLDTATQLAHVLAQSIAQISASLDDKPRAPVEEHSAYQQAKAARDNAALNLSYTIVRASFGGVIGKQPQIGDLVAAGQPVVSLVSKEDIWIEANFKETDLTNVLPGQYVDVEVDTYPGRHWKGRVASISQATGAEFSVLPAQNASGNWVKVVQRIPVRITVERQANDPEIRAGMSAYVEIDTHSTPQGNPAKQDSAEARMSRISGAS